LAIHRFLADHNLDQRIIDGFIRRVAGVDCILLRHVQLERAEDETVLAWAEATARVVLTHDVNTMPGFAYERIRNDQGMSGLVVIPDDLGIGAAVDDLVVIATRFDLGRLSQRVLYRPLRTDR